MDIFLKQNFTENCTVPEKLLGLSNWHFLMETKPIYCQKSLISRAQKVEAFCSHFTFFSECSEWYMTEELYAFSS